MKKTPHGSFGSMPKGHAQPGKGGTVDHCSVGKPIGKHEGPSDPLSPSCGRPGNFEGGGGKRVNVPKEKDYSRNGM